MTRTFAELEISQSAWNEIARKLRDAGYDHAFVDEKTIDMQGIGLTPAPPAPVETVITPEGQRFFRYPERVQPIDFLPRVDMKGAVLTLRDIADMRGIPETGTYTLDPPAVAFTTYKDGKHAGVVGVEPARPVETNTPALKGMEIAQEPLVLDIPAFLKP
jgi:hypothetical protein